MNWGVHHRHGNRMGKKKKKEGLHMWNTEAACCENGKMGARNSDRIYVSPHQILVKVVQTLVPE